MLLALSPIVTIVVPALLLGLSYVLARREWKQYRAANEIGSDLFVYGKGRLVRRLIGIGVLAALGFTLFAMGLLPPSSPRGATVYLSVIVGEVALLVILPIVDLIETGRSARPGKGIRHADSISRSEARRPRTRTPPDRPR
jgi:hypothetical protein